MQQVQTRMEKAQAIQIIRDEYQNGYSPTDIAQNLSQQLGAPFDLVYKFVMQTLDAEFEPAEEPIPPPSPMAAPEPVAAAIPGYETLEEESGKLVEEASATENPPAETVQAPVFIEAAAPDLKALEQNPKVEKFILQMLSTHQKTSDTVMAVCERTGLGWDEAQRLVARVATKNRATLKTRQNRVPMILSIIALLAGAALVFAGISEAYNIYTLLQGAQSGEEMLVTAGSQEFLRSAFWSLALGSVLLLGGTVGLFSALRYPFE